MTVRTAGYYVPTAKFPEKSGCDACDVIDYKDENIKPCHRAKAHDGDSHAPRGDADPQRCRTPTSQSVGAIDGRDPRRCRTWIRSSERPADIDHRVRPQVAHNEDTGSSLFLLTGHRVQGRDAVRNIDAARARINTVASMIARAQTEPGWELDGTDLALALILNLDAALHDRDQADADGER